MRRWLPRTLFGQVLLALLVGLAAAQAIGAWLLLDDRSRFAGRLLGMYTAQRIAGMVSLLDPADPQERVRLVRALSVPPTRISLDEPWRTLEAPPSDEAESFARALKRELGESRELQVLSLLRGAERTRGERARLRDKQREPSEVVSGQRFDGFPERESRRRAPRLPVVLVIAQARLADGAVVTFRHALPQAPVDRPLRVIGLIAVSAITVALLAGWTVRRLTRPLATLAAAASELGRNLERPPLPETGPTEVARAASAFNAMQRELKRYLDTRAQALAGVSHDLRLPITRARLRLERVTDPDIQHAIGADLDEMEQMIASTLEFLRAGSSGEEAVRTNVNALIEGVADDMEALGASVRLQGRAQAPLLVQPQALRRCLSNLLDNARRYGGPQIDVTVADGDQCLLVTIEDRGPGIPAAERERVFEPFVRLEPSRAQHTGGSGLGLAISRAVARSHGGDITLTDRPGGGLRAELRLPRRAQVPSREGESTQPAA